MKFIKEEVTYEIHNLYNHIGEIECSDEYANHNYYGEK